MWRRKRRNEMLEQCFSLAEMLSYRMLDLGSWNDFCDYVEKRCIEVWGQQEECNRSNVVADVVRQLRESPFFL